jgi:hypothetical protein
MLGFPNTGFAGISTGLAPDDAKKVRIRGGQISAQATPNSNPGLYVQGSALIPFGRQLENLDCDREHLGIRIRFIRWHQAAESFLESLLRVLRET